MSWTRVFWLNKKDFTLSQRALSLQLTSGANQQQQLPQRSFRKHPEWRRHDLAWFVHGPGQDGSAVGDKT